MKKRLKLILAIAALTSAALVLVLIFWVGYIVKNLPPEELLENRRIAEATKIYDRTGTTLLYEIYGEERRIVIPLSEIPEAVKQATIAVEDAEFYRHPAFDWKSIVRALIANLLSGQVVQGGSTITQQLVKNAFLSPEKTLSRKIRELALAMRLEQKFTKDRILELYLNQIPYGSNAYGIEAASQIFFGKSAKDLNLAQAALLASLPKAPSYYSPWGTNREALIQRRDYVLRQMRGAGLITETQEQKALAQELKFSKPSQGIKAPHFVMMVQDYLNQQYGEDFVRTNGLKVITTLDSQLQELSERLIEEGVKRNQELYNGGNAALVAEDPKSGQVLALVGSGDYFDTKNEGNFNVASQGLRQPGSALKPFIYAAAFKKGYTPETVVFDLETEFDTTGFPEKSYQPENYDGRFRGPITLRSALANSINIPAVKVLYLVGLNDALKTLQEFGLTSLREKSRYGLSLILGGGEVRLIDLVNAYSVLAEDGRKHRQTLILKVTAKNKVLEAYADSAEQIIEPQYARLINDILSDAEARLPIFGTSLNIPWLSEHQIAVKTGTSNDYRDAWAIGYTPSLVVGVWAGNNDNQSMTKQGASFRAAGPIWKDFMSEALKNRAPVVFKKPEPMLAKKPMFNGEYIVSYRTPDALYPQIHELLFYVAKGDPLGPRPEKPETDPQFNNWEQPVLAWASANIQNFSAMNQAIPEDGFLADAETENLNPSNLKVAITRPLNGDFVDQPLTFEAQISSVIPLKKIELYFNGELVNQKAGDLGKEVRYLERVVPKKLELQNSLKLVVFDEKDNAAEKQLILFSTIRRL